MPKEVAYNKKKKQTNALSSLWQLRALKLHGIRIAGRSSKATLVGFYHAHRGPLAHHSRNIYQGSGQRQAIKAHTAHSTQHTAKVQTPNGLW